MKKFSVRSDFSKNKKVLRSSHLCTIAQKSIHDVVQSVDKKDIRVLSFEGGVIKIATGNAFIAQEVALMQSQWKRLIGEKTGEAVTRVVYKNTLF